MSVFRILALGVASLSVSGCVAGLYGAQYALSAGVLAAQAYTLNEVMRDGELIFEAETIELTPEGATALSSARRIAIFPALDGSDGETVDVASSVSSTSIIESSKTTRWVRSQRLNLNDLSEQERLQGLRRFGRAMGADLVIATQESGTRTQAGIFSAPTIEMEFVTLALSVPANKAVWKERHILKIDGLQNVDNSKLNAFLVRGIATRFESARAGNPS